MSTARAAGVQPERDVADPERGLHVRVAPLELARIASIVSMASRRVSSWPVAIGKVRQSTMMSPTRIPQLLGEVGDQPLGDRDLLLGGAGLARSRRWSARPPRRRARATSGMVPGEAGVRPVAVLEVHRVDHGAAAAASPGRPAMTSGSVESSTSGRVEAVASRPATSACRPRRRGRRSPRRRRAGARRRGSAPRAISTQSSQRPASIASRNAFDPLALVRSPMDRYAVSCRNGTCWYSEATPASGAGPPRRSPRARRPLDDLAQVLRRGAAAAADQGRARTRWVNTSCASASSAGVSG